MDDTQHSRVSDAAAAATRKRRSSILKSQRPARTPFSELEFNVATPTDTAKSRRVSFSKRTGVAEFVTNEGTTTWKNFYEEHNKSLESSSNDSEANASRQPIGHLGKRIFDQQFQEVEAVDFMSGLANGSLNVNFSQQPISLECTEGKLTAPNNKFELSAFTEQSKLFGNDFTAPSLGEGSGRIDVNFSAIQQVEKDDLDEFEKDLQRGANSIGCLGPFSDRQNMCEYIEVDLNMTHVVKNDEDMSITDTVHSPVQDVSKSTSIDKKAILNTDWAADKENIAINPYAAPCETNFAVNEEPDQVLVFDGKRLTLQPDAPEKEKNYRQTLLPNSSAETPERKTIVLNVNDDLPNYLGDMRNSKCENSFYNGFQEIKSNEDEISDTLQLSRVYNKPTRKTIHDNTGNISITQGLPTNIICQAAIISQDDHPTKKKSIVFDKSTNDISITEAVPVKILSSGESLPERGHTVVYEDETANISITQAVPSNILVNDNPDLANKEIFESDDDNKSVYQTLSSNSLGEKPSIIKSIVFDDDSSCNVSFTQAVPSNILLSDKLAQEKRQTIIYQNDTGNLSVTQALPTNVILSDVEPNDEANPERRQTIVYNDDTGNISVTQALPSNILLEKLQLDENNEVESTLSSQSPDNITTKDSDASRRRTIVYENDTGNISLTQAILGQLLPRCSQEIPVDALNDNPETKTHAHMDVKPKNRKRQTIVYDNDDCDISMTEAISAKILDKVRSEGKTILCDENEANIATTLAVSTNVFLLDKIDSEIHCVEKPEETKEIKEKITDYEVYDEGPNLPVEVRQDQDPERKLNDSNPDVNDCDMSMTMAISKVASLREIEKGDMSMTKPIPTELITFSTEPSNKLKDKLSELTEPDQIVSRQSDVIVLQSSRPNSKPMLQSSISEQVELRRIRDIYNEIFKESSDMTAAIDKSETFVADDVMSSPKEDTSASASIIHPRVEEKVNQLSLVSTDWKVDKVSDGENDAIIQTDVDEKLESLANTEMSMSVTTIDSGTDDKNIMARVYSPRVGSPRVGSPRVDSPRVDSTRFPAIKKDSDDNSSSESMFYITKDEDDALDKEADSDISKKTKTNKIIYKHLPMQHLDENLEAVDQLQKKLEQLQSVVSQNRSNTKRFIDEVASLDMEEEAEGDEDDKLKQQRDIIKNANNDTQELLNMLTNLTDNIDSDSDIVPIVIKTRGSEMTEHKRLSFAPSRQSIVLSREDLLSNISMAQAALQKSRLALDDSDSLGDDSKDTSVDIANKSGRASNDVVKTLQFNDESISEDNLAKFSPLKKTAFGETSYMHETKSKVIPTYLKDVSDGIKELMLDLVKPVNNENLPFEIGIDRDVPAIASTQSTQIQANLAASSQIDLDPDVCSIPESGSSLANKARTLRNPVRFSGNMLEFDDQSYKEKWLHTHLPVEQPSASAVLIFDHLNPLNNVLLPPMDYTEVHKYNPIVKSEETLRGSEATHSMSPQSHSIGIHFNHTNRDDNSRDFEVQTVTTKKQKVVIRSNTSQKDAVYKRRSTPFTQEEACSTNTQTTRNKISPRSSPMEFRDRKREPRRNESLSIRSLTTRPHSLDQSVDAVLTKLRDDEVNTTIAMKRNKELLETSSSLTLVDDALEGQNSEVVLPDKEFSNPRIRFSRSHLVNIEEQALELDNITKISEMSLQDRHSPNSNAHISKGKKRIYSPATDKHRHQTSVEITPKPLMKMQKISGSPKVQIKVPKESSSTDDTSAHSMEPERDENKCSYSPKSRDKKSPKSKTGKPGQTITVRQLIADCISFDTGFQRINNVEEKKLLSDINAKSESLTELSQSDVSFTSSKDLKSMKDVVSTDNMDCQSPHQSTMQVLPSQVDWHPELMYVTSSSQCDSDAGVNVVAKIDMLPFMGSHECEWESSSSVDTWSFRLLHGRLRLTARLAHRLDNATRTRVRGDTPVLDMTVDAVQHDRKNPVATMCVRFACETMRHMVERALRGACHARDVPPLLRRCAAVVRVALRWGRAMHDAKLHLAYTMDHEGNLSLKVANIPLRSVWEVTMRIELVLDDKHSLASPRATNVRVLPVLSDVLVPDADVQRALDHTPQDWGHAPRTIWRVFRLLKHKKRDDDLLLA